MPPLASYGRDGFKNWLLIFDGLDEFAREGIGSETAAQEFATALSDWRLLTSGLINAKFLVLGRAPSMQQARRRLGLQGPGTLHVLDMMPIEQTDQHLTNSYGQKTIISDPKKLADHDQRSIFWIRWAVAKNIPTTVPLSMTAESLEDLTKEPLLAYLLILSGYATDNWEQAARNRNYIYEEIFNGIWNREKSKQARISLNDIGKTGFESIMQALGIAAWRGGGRTGDENTFNVIRDVFVKPDVLKKAKACGIADLDNVAILFYTRKDEIDGRGYEFLHKSFGEYLTAKGLLECFCRWSDQFQANDNDFTEQDFLSRWLKVAGQSHITSEILEFLRGEVSLKAGLSNAEPWVPARGWAVSAIDLMDYVIRYGFAGFESYSNWRLAAKAQANAELNLFAVLNSCARIGYPEDLFGLHVDFGGWSSGPVVIPILHERREAFPDMIDRMIFAHKLSFTQLRDGSMGIGHPFVTKLLSRLHIKGCNLASELFGAVDFTGSKIEDVTVFSSTSHIGIFRFVSIVSTRFYNVDFFHVDFSKSKIIDSSFRDCSFDNVDFDGSELTSVIISLSDLSGVSWGSAKGARLIIRDSLFEVSECSQENFQGIVHENCVKTDRALYIRKYTSRRSSSLVRSGSSLG